MPPFYSRDRDRLFEKILHSKLRFPNYFSDAAVNILTLLMQRNWKKRLGSYQSSNPAKYNNDPKKKSFAQLKGAQQIKRHIFFKSIDWKLLYERKLKPPFTPKLNDDQTNNFDAEFTEMPIYSMDANERSRYIHREKRKYLLKFDSFTYVRDEGLLLQPNETDDDDDDSENEEDEDESTSNSDDSESTYEEEDSTSNDEDAEDDGEDDNNQEDKPQQQLIQRSNASKNIQIVNSNNPNDNELSEDSEQSDSENNNLNANNNDNDDNNDNDVGHDDGFEVFE